MPSSLFVALVHGSFRRPSGQAHICDIGEETYWQDVLLCDYIDVYNSCHEAEVMKFAPYNILLRETYFEMHDNIISILHLLADTAHPSF